MSWTDLLWDIYPCPTGAGRPRTPSSGGTPRSVDSSCTGGSRGSCIALQIIRISHTYFTGKLGESYFTEGEVKILIFRKVAVYNCMVFINAPIFLSFFSLIWQNWFFNRIKIFIPLNIKRQRKMGFFSSYKNCMKNMHLHIWDWKRHRAAAK